MYSPPPVWIFEPNSFTSADHPHVCGENLPACWIWYTQFGPSPRVWGERRCSCDWSALKRTIPTCVGRTRSSIVRADALTDHPHVCGENSAQSPATYPDLGPSPRVWGEPTRRRVSADRRPTIP